MGAIPRGQIPEYNRLRRMLKGRGTRLFECGCLQEKDEDVFIMPNGSARCNKHRWARVKAVRLVCKRCGKIADLDPRGANGKYCPECSKELYPTGPKERRVYGESVFTENDIEYIKSHYHWETMTEMAEALGIPLKLVSEKCKELGIKTKHPWTHRKEMAIDKFFSETIPRLTERMLRGEL